jgi:hypothetical protein
MPPKKARQRNATIPNFIRNTNTENIMKKETAFIIDFILGFLQRIKQYFMLLWADFETVE